MNAFSNCPVRATRLAHTIFLDFYRRDIFKIQIIKLLFYFLNSCVVFSVFGPNILDILFSKLIMIIVSTSKVPFNFNTFSAA